MDRTGVTGCIRQHPVHGVGLDVAFMRDIDGEDNGPCPWGGDRLRSVQLLPLGSRTRYAGCQAVWLKSHGQHQLQRKPAEWSHGEIPFETICLKLHSKAGLGTSAIFPPLVDCGEP